MTIEALIAGSGIPRIEAELLVASALRRDRTWVLAHGDDAVAPVNHRLIESWYARRRSGEPVAYIIGEREFFGRMFFVTPDVLIPRPATEELVRATLAFLDHPQDAVHEADAGIVIVSRVLRSELHPHIVVDAGTGSGCIAITLALECPEIQVIATDISAEALAVARTNADLHHVTDRVGFLKGKDLDPVRDLREPFLLVSNPPYIPEDRVLQREVMVFEPQQALFGGEDGVNMLRRISDQARQHPFCCGLVMECEADQQEIFRNS
ncbi:MAG: peptide chain release factor N(5)-glutamine methyltransferase [Candidatus Peribacteraceae bacterium]|jgi:release factor glutamine methyltransferase|nr:peptide chain release factor N(5)-glutamine methyltransferase [Candidatus Peribacteraceae bacterium]